MESCECMNVCCNAELSTYGLNRKTTYEQFETMMRGMTLAERHVYELESSIKRLEENIAHYQDELNQKQELVAIIKRGIGAGL